MCHMFHLENNCYKIILVVLGACVVPCEAVVSFWRVLLKYQY